MTGAQGRTLLPPALQSAARPHWERAGRRGGGINHCLRDAGTGCSVLGVEGRGVECDEPGKDDTAQRSSWRTGGNRRATDGMITFLVLNTSGVTIIPMTVIALRMGYGSIDPTCIILPSIIATLMSTICGLTLDYIIRRKNVK